MFSKEGSEIAELGASVNDRNKAAELLGKRYALWTDKKELSGNVGVTIVDDLED
jgi:phage terminase small subunit